jgi:hypothetical protein
MAQTVYFDADLLGELFGAQTAVTPALDSLDPNFSGCSRHPTNGYPLAPSPSRRCSPNGYRHSMSDLVHARVVEHLRRLTLGNLAERIDAVLNEAARSQPTACR